MPSGIKTIKALVLNSGGVDSTTCVGIAVNKYGKENVSTATIKYGQKHSKELSCAEKVAEHYGLNNYVLDLSNVFQYSNCSLLKHSDEEIIHKSYAEQIEQNGEGKVSTYVPFRNGLFLAAVASLASSIYPEDEVRIFIGAHADDAAGHAYADCSFRFIRSMNSAIMIGTYGKVELEAPLVEWTKKDIVRVGLDLKVPYHLTWSCYEGNEHACGTCGTCIDRLNAFEAHGVRDPINYEGDFKNV